MEINNMSIGNISIPIMALLVLLNGCVANRYSSADVTAFQVIQKQNYKVSMKAIQSNEMLPQIKGKTVYIDDQSRKGVSFVGIYEWLQIGQNIIQNISEGSDYQMIVLEESCNTDIYNQDNRRFVIIGYYRNEKTIAESSCTYSLIIKDQKNGRKKSYDLKARNEEIVKESYDGIILIFPINGNINHTKSQISTEDTTANIMNW